MSAAGLAAAAGSVEASRGVLRETFYISHGSPKMSIDETVKARKFLQEWRENKKVLSQTPKAILVISAHWETDEPTVNGVAGDGSTLDTIHDFNNFPECMYQLRYPAPGSPELARRVKDLLVSAGFDQTRTDETRGLDHGAWVPLMLMYPEANIPVCQLSVQTEKTAIHHYNMGKALAPLKEEGVLILGSGSAIHNLPLLKRTTDPAVPSWALEFDCWLEDALINGRYDDVNEYEEKAPHAKTAHPRPEHIYPLHVAMGASGPSSKAELIHRTWGFSSMSYSSFKFTS